MQRSGTEAIRTQIQPSKPKRDINNITNNQNTKRTYGQPSEQLFPKRLAETRTPKTGQREPQQNYRLGKVSNELLAPTSPLVSEVVQNI